VGELESSVPARLDEGLRGPGLLELPTKKGEREMKTTLLGVGLFALATQLVAQVSQAAFPKTKLEAFDAQEGVVIVQGFSRIAELRGPLGGSVIVQAQEFTNPTSGKRESGITIEVKESGRLERENRSFVDYEEIGPLLKGMDYISKIDKSVTKLADFQADYRTKGGLRISVFSGSHGEVMAAVHSGTIGGLSTFLKFSDLAALQAHISAAKDRLDAVK
jgi:hypothetical protein